MIAIVLGTRPEIIKTAPIVIEAARRGIAVGIIHTGQHYSPEMDAKFFNEMNLPAPIANAHVGSHAASKQLGLMMQRLADIFDEIKPSVVMVEGDTNSVLAGALAAYKAGIPVAHLEAGLRSDDWNMPEESNRVLADRLSRWMFCPTEIQKDRLLKEGITLGVHVVGNTIVDASLHFSKIAYQKSDIAERLRVNTIPYALLTMHRPSNVDDPARLRSLIGAIANAASRLNLKIVFPVHPRTRNLLDQNKIDLPEPFIAIESLGYLDLLRLQGSAEIVLTDSGGIQEEACILRVPSVTLRANTERPETLHVGASVLHSEADGDALFTVMRSQMTKTRDWTNPFGDGKTAERVMDILEKS
ncbi:MAG: UDP-N-acetylglucosamine 2-epimerase (non-hydrolyzing) [Patescibacteria group bacterium]